MLEILEDRYNTRSTLVTSQLPVEKWHGTIADPTFADAILDRLVHNATTHLTCNFRQKDTDEKIGQVIALKRRRIPARKDRRLAIKFFASPTGGAPMAAVFNLDITGAIRRWISAFHAALYREPIPLRTRITIQSPFQKARLVGDFPEFEALPAQHAIFVQTIKTNRVIERLDGIRTNNGKMIYECVWNQTDDGAWICVFALDIYKWKDLGDIHSLSPRGCAGAYILPSADFPPNATRGTTIHVDVRNRDAHDPFGD